MPWWQRPAWLNTWTALAVVWIATCLALVVFVGRGG